MTIPGLGTVQGVATASTRWFLGLPYGQAPVGDLRWRSPVAYGSWSPATWNATAYGANCAQNTSTWQPPMWPTSEDCLFLNIYAPLSSAPNRPAQGWPVWVWLHGGGFENGGGNETRLNGTYNAARTSEIVVVTLNYRLGAFGFLGSADLRGRTADGSTGNFGVQDQRLALQWVQQNVGWFGGDASRVFLVGESAGAMSVSVHMSTPKSWGLFSRAGMQSGGFIDPTAKDMPATEEFYAQFLNRTGCALPTPEARVACLLALSTEALTYASWLAELNLPIYQALPWTPTVDGVELTDFPYALARAGKVARVPMLIGTVRDEGTSFCGLPWNLDQAGYDAFIGDVFRFNATVAAQLAALYPPAAYNTTACCTNFYWAAAAMMGDYLMACPAREAAQYLSHTNPTFTFVFDHVPFGNASNPSANEFVSHACDIPYGYWVLPLLDPPSGYTTATNMANAWINFAATGNPNAPNSSLALPLPIQWPAFVNGSSDPWFLISETPTVVTGLKSAQCAFWEMWRRPT